jgi:O-antigen/teichoic acid export membrane protein
LALAPHMQKKFISNLLLIVVLNLLVKPFAIFGIDATVQNRVGEEAYGMYFSLLNLSFLFNILMDLGINNFTTKNIATHPHIVSRYMGKLLSFRLLLFLIYAAVTLGFGLLIGYEDAQLYLLYFLILNQLFVTLIAYFRSHFAGLLFFKTEALISILDRLLLILICGSILINTYSTHTFRIEWFVWIQSICYGITAIIAFLILVGKIGVPKIKWHWSFSRAIVKKSIPYALLVLLMMFYTRTDSIMLERLHPNGKEEAGIYAQGFRLLDALFMFAMIFSGLLFPLFSKYLKEKITVMPLLKMSGNLLIGGALFLSVFCFFNAEFILNLIYDHNVASAIPTFQWLMFSFVGMCITLIFGTLMTANGNLKFLNFISFGGIVLNVSLNVYLIPSYGAAGAAFATLSTQSITALFQLIFCLKSFKIKVSPKLLIQYLLYLLVLSFWFMVAENYTTSYLLITFEIAGGIAALFIFKLIDIHELKRQFLSKELDEIKV